MDLRFRERMTPELFIRAQKLHMGHRWVAMIIFPIGMGLYIFFGPYSGISSLATKLAAFPLTFLFPAAMYWLTRRQWLKIARLERAQADALASLRATGYRARFGRV